MINIKKLCLKKVKGFSGITHMLIATLLFQIVWFLPFFNNYVSEIKETGFIGIILFWGVVIGASILPDLDNNTSTAKYQLGFLGQIISMFMVMISSIVTSLTKLKKDNWKSQHRLFWHAPSLYIISFFSVMFLHKESEYNIIEIFKNVEGNINIPEISMVIMFLIITACSFYMFVNAICYNLSRFFLQKLFKFLKIGLTIGCLVGLCFMPISYLKFLAYACCIGGLFHNIGDFFSLGSIPIFFPIPVKGQMWLRPHMPFQIETGGVANKVLNFILLIAVAIMFLIMFGILVIN